MSALEQLYATSDSVTFAIYQIQYRNGTGGVKPFQERQAEPPNPTYLCRMVVLLSVTSKGLRSPAV
jgi:hypothetical protein